MKEGNVQKAARRSRVAVSVDERLGRVLDAYEKAGEDVREAVAGWLRRRAKSEERKARAVGAASFSPRVGSR